MEQRNNCATLGTFLAAAIFLGSCVGGDRPGGLFIADPCDSITPGVWTTDFVRDYNYAEGRIFDLAYPGEIGPNDSVHIRLYARASLDNPDSFEALMKCGPLDPSGEYDVPNVRMVEITEQPSWQLMIDQDSSHCPYAIYSGYRHPVTVGVVIEIFRIDQSGQVTSIDTLGHMNPAGRADTIRVLQPARSDQTPSHPAWNLMWRNCYRVPRYASTEELDLKIFKGLPGREGVESNLDYQEISGVAGDPYINILGLDQVNNDNTRLQLPDGLMDPFVDVHNEEWGLVIFPEREPFNSSRIFVDGKGQPSDSLVEKIPTLYRYGSSSERLSISKYYLQVRTWRPDYIR